MIKRNFTFRLLYDLLEREELKFNKPNLSAIELKLDDYFNLYDLCITRGFRLPQVLAYDDDFGVLHLESNYEYLLGYLYFNEAILRRFDTHLKRLKLNSYEVDFIINSYNEDYKHYQTYKDLLNNIKIKLT